jgi:phenylacetyl-CoA:acceptor oxidoreductase subunit 1
VSRYVMVADLRRCVGCQTCTAACRVTNATPAWVEWRWVLDVEAGEYPDVWRAFVPVGCQHCANPPCLEVCPSGATWRRDDGIVVIDYDLCMGCSYCAVACPYQARYKIDRPRYAYGELAIESEAARADPRRIGVVTKCDFCAERIDAGRDRGLVPGVDPEATPVCASSCISRALVFGDVEDPTSPVSRLLADSQSFRMHEELGTEPGFYYLWEKKA